MRLSDKYIVCYKDLHTELYNQINIVQDLMLVSKYYGVGILAAIAHKTFI